MVNAPLTHASKPLNVLLWVPTLGESVEWHVGGAGQVIVSVE